MPKMCAFFEMRLCENDGGNGFFVGNEVILYRSRFFLFFSFRHMDDISIHSCWFACLAVRFFLRHQLPYYEGGSESTYKTAVK